MHVRLGHVDYSVAEGGLHCYGGGALALEGFGVDVHGVHLTPPAKYKNVDQTFF